MREVWSARVRGFEGQFERAVLAVDDEGRFVLSTSPDASTVANDVAVIEHDDAVRLLEVLEDEVGSGS